MLGVVGLAVWLLAFFWKKVRPIRDEGLFFALMLLLGPGIMVNCISKPYCGRPRPHLTKQFGGGKDFLPLFVTGGNLEGDCNSFPSGHASMGFFLMAPAFVLYRRRLGWAVVFLFLGLIAGCTIGVARMAAGAILPATWSGRGVSSISRVCCWRLFFVSASVGSIPWKGNAAHGKSPVFASQESANIGLTPRDHKPDASVWCPC